jgi:hypothetical protein
MLCFQPLGWRFSTLGAVKSPDSSKGVCLLAEACQNLELQIHCEAAVFEVHVASPVCRQAGVLGIGFLPLNRNSGLVTSIAPQLSFKKNVVAIANIHP